MGLYWPNFGLAFLIHLFCMRVFTVLQVYTPNVTHLKSTKMPPKPGEKKRSRVSSSEEEKSSHLLIDDAILKDLQAKLGKLNLLYGKGNPSVVIGSFSVGILPYGPSPRKRFNSCFFFLFSKAGKFICSLNY